MQKIKWHSGKKVVKVHGIGLMACSPQPKLYTVQGPLNFELGSFRNPIGGGSRYGFRDAASGRFVCHSRQVAWDDLSDAEQHARNVVSSARYRQVEQRNCRDFNVAPLERGPDHPYYKYITQRSVCWHLQLTLGQLQEAVNIDPQHLEILRMNNNYTLWLRVTVASREHN